MRALLLAFLLGSAVHAEELNFDQALRQMAESNVEVLVQKTKVEVAHSQVTIAHAAFSPTFDLQASEKSLGGNSPQPAPGADIYATQQLYSANAKWNVFSSGADLAAVRAANQERNVQESLLDDVYLGAETKAANALFNLIEKKQALEAYRKSEEAAGHFLEIARARFNKSLLSREETDKVLVDQSNAEAIRADAEIQYNNARAAVAALLGHAQVAATWPWEKNLNLEQAKAFLSEGAAKAAVDARPDFLAARFAVESANARSRSLFRSLLPTVDLSYSLGETHSRGTTISGWTSMATLTIPLWSGLKNYSGYKIQVQNKYAAEARLTQLRRDVGGTVEAAQANFRLTVQQYQARARNLGVARHILGQDEARFKIGRADANELHQDLTRVTQAEILAVEGMRQAHVAYVTLLHEFGKRVQ